MPVCIHCESETDETVLGEPVCESCRREEYFTCDRCNDITSNEDRQSVSGSSKNTQKSEIVIENIAIITHDYVITQQRTSHNGGLDFEVTAEWKHNRDEYRMQMANEWVSCPTQRIPFIEKIPEGCGKIEFSGTE